MIEKQFDSKSDKLFVLLFFLIYLVLGLSIYQDYGISWDEPISRMNGLVNLKYLQSFNFFRNDQLAEHLHNIPDLQTWMDRDYGVAFEVPSVVIELILNLKDDQSIFILRHLLTFLFYFIGVLSVYATCKKIYGDYRIGLLASLMLILSPRFFAESFYNSKDIVFMASIAITIYTMTCFLNKPSFMGAFFHGFSTALAIDIRIMGVLIFLLTIAALVVLFIKHSISNKKLLGSAFTFILSTCLFVIAMFPFLWSNPWENFTLVLKNMSHFRWNSSLLYMGEMIQTTQLPWHYIPVWILVTTPIPYIGAMLIGVCFTLKQLISNKFYLWSNNSEMHDLIYLIILVGPILAVIILGSVLYDGWRQLYFIYPAFILLAIKGIVTAFVFFKNKKIVQYLLIAILVANFTYSAYWIWVAHPIQNIYFNSFAGKDWKNKFELDYWGLGNREALQFIVNNDASSQITLSADSSTPLERSVMMLDKNDASRIIIVDKQSQPLYLLTNYRQVADKDDSKYFVDYDLFYRREVLGETILSVYKRKK